MPRFFFNLSNGKTARDDYGEACESLQDARSYATHMAGELGRNKSDDDIRGMYVSVTDEEGNEVFRTPVVNAGSTKAISPEHRQTR